MPVFLSEFELLDSVLKQSFLVLQYCTQDNEITGVCVSGQDMDQTCSEGLS